MIAGEVARDPRAGGNAIDDVHVHHAIVGRTRVRIARLRGCPDALRALARRLRAREGVTGVQESEWSGALLVEHDKSLASEAVVEAILEFLSAGLTALTAAPPAAAPDNWHALPAALAQAAMGSPHGLSQDEAQSRLARIGENRLPEPAPISAAERLLEQFKSLPVALLGVSAVLSLATGGALDAALTLGVIALNAGIGMTTEDWTAKLIRRLSQQSDPDVTVVRDGTEAETPTSRIAPGDWIVLKPGDAIPADARLISSDALSVDESALTGESVPVDKRFDAHVPHDTPLSARATMIYRGCVVTGGSGVAVVTATGQGTEIGRVRALLEGTTPPAPPMERALDRLGVKLTVASLGASAVLAVMMGARGERFAGIVKSALALAVSAIPEGLPALSASTKALAAHAMAREGAYVRNINVVETAASIDVLCLDKTGTLTQNCMAVTVVRSTRQLHAIDARTGAASPPLGADSRFLAKVAILCNDAHEEPDGSLFGSGTERALLSLSGAAGLNLASVRQRYPRIGVLERSQRRNYMATEHRVRGIPFVAVKGAPYEVLAMCASARIGGRVKALDATLRDQIRQQNDELARQGLRVLGFAYGRGLSLDHGETLHGLEWLGLVGLHDPVRPGAAEALATFHRAGIRRIILTGDQAATAYKLAADLGLGSDGSLEVVDAADIRGLPQNELAALARTAEVFARVTPADKLAIVKALQANGHVVAMTGDGVNDGPALRAADVGIAMGKTGTDVARDVADIVIAQDDLNALADALARGRAAEENLRRAVRFLIATNASEVVLLLIEALQGSQAMESPAELFWLNLTTDIFPALGIAMAPPAPDVLDRPPRPVTDDIFDRRATRSIAGDAVSIAIPAILTNLVAMKREGGGPHVHGLTFLTLATRQLSYALDVSLKSGVIGSGERPFQLGVLASYALLAAPFALRGLRSVMRIAPPTLPEAILAMGMSLLPFAHRLWDRANAESP